MLRLLLVIITGFLAMLMAFSALACHMQGHPNRWVFTVVALVTIILFLGVASSKDLTDGPR